MWIVHWAEYQLSINLERRIMKNSKIIFVIFAGSLLLVPLSCRKDPKTNQYTAGVEVVPYTVGQKSVLYYDSYPGTVAALNEVELHSQVSGYITGIYFKEGSEVVKGQKLYEIDRRKYQAALEQVKANVKIAEANLEKARRNADRYTSLMEQNAIAKQIYEDAMTNLQDATMQLKSAQSAQLNAETDFNYSLITAPFTGTIGFSLVKPGTFIVPGQTLLNTISTNDPVGVDFFVNEKSLTGFLDLKKRETSKADSTFRILLPDNSEYQYNGKLSVIDRAVDRLTGTIKLRLEFPNSEGNLRPGMNCKVKVLNGSSGSRILIPFKAVVEQMGEYFVYAIENNTVKQVKVHPDLNLGEYIAVKGGVMPGEQIVLDGIQKIHNGSQVTISSPLSGSTTVSVE
jgi:membrane fusion protein (multidrug efflux system)